MPLDLFHPLISGWFSQRFGEPTEPQLQGWPQIAAGNHTLIAAPTGSGKTLAAFLACLDTLVRESLSGTLEDATQVVYVSPLKALSNDVERNLQGPLAEIRAFAQSHGHQLGEIRVQLRTGDTTQAERQRALRRPPHIVVTTPESLYLMLTGGKSRETLRGVRTVIVDEIHALVRDKRGSHLALSLERLEHLCERPPLRVGLSATQRPIDEIAAFLVGSRHLSAEGAADCRVVDVGHLREMDLDIELAGGDLSAVCSNDQWAALYERLTELIHSHRSTLVFVNTRRLAERVSHHLGELLGEDAVASHHGSLSREIRLSAEQRLKDGQLRAIVATASLELGIDVGFIDLVCQIGSPRSIATFLQRVGRSGHSLGVIPKGRLFPLTRDSLVEGLALLRAVRARRLDQVRIPHAPLDILAQQIIAAAACEEWQEDELFEMCRGAWPYRGLTREVFDEIVRMLSEGIVPGRRRSAYLLRDAIGGRLRARRGARLAAVTSGGAIPETADYRVITEDEGAFVGTVNEDFAIESLAGDVFLLGNTSWQIRAVRGGEVVVVDAQGAPATIPFWLGEAPGRTQELSAEVSRLRDDLAARLVDRANQGDSALAISPEAISAAALWLAVECGVREEAARQATHYVAAQVAALGLVPTQQRVVFERFFDESGGMQLVIHAPFGTAINRAWGLAMRKRFCRSFNFELQASADDNGVVLSLGPQHSFPIDQMFRMLNCENGEPLLIQALLAAPMFKIRWRWNATRSLAILRHQGGRKVPPPLQRFRSDDLLSAVFPASTACLENVVGDIELPDHPLIRQTVHDCLHEAMDLHAWIGVLRSVEQGAIELVARDTREPSPFCYELLNANPYSFLDDAPLEERRARAVAQRRSLPLEEIRDLGRFDPRAIEQVRHEARPIARDADELHDVLLATGAIPADEGGEWGPWFRSLVNQGRAAELHTGTGNRLWFAAENWPLMEAAYPDATCRPTLNLPPQLCKPREASEAFVALVRGRLEISGPLTAASISADLGIRESAVDAALEALEGEGFALRGTFTDHRTNGAPGPLAPKGEKHIEWCERRLLARIHRLTMAGIRSQVRPVEPADFMRFLLEHQHAARGQQWSGRDGVRSAIAQLQGFELAAGAWEYDVLPARVREYDPTWLDNLAHRGELCWGRLTTPRRREDDPTGTIALTRVIPITLLERANLPWLMPVDRPSVEQSARGDAQTALAALKQHGALFFDDLKYVTGLLPSQLEEALAELSGLGLVTADAFAPVRGLVSPDGRTSQGNRFRQRHRRTARAKQRHARWSSFPPVLVREPPADRVEQWARQLLRRYGVMFRDLLIRETAAPTWPELAAVYRRMELRGEVQGGRFVSNVAGEQYAETSAVSKLRQMRETAPSGDWVAISAADPLNLVGIILPGARIPAFRSNALVLRDGQLLASQQGGEVRFHGDAPDAATRERIARALGQFGIIRLREDSLDAAEAVGH